jgi:parallel beta-helix repeat protein
VTFHEQVDSATAGDFGLTVNAAGQTTFQKAVGTTALEYLATTGGGITTINGGAVTTSGAAGQVYGDAVEIGVRSATLAAGSGPVTFDGTVNSATGGARSLTVNTSGATTFAAAVGTSRALDSLATNANGTTRISGGTITTSGSAGQVYGDAVVLLTDTTLNAGSGAVTFAAAVDGPGSLTVNTTGVTTFTAAVGGGTPLAAITTNAGGTSQVNGGLVRTMGTQSWLDNVVMPIDTLFHSVNGSIGSGPANTFSAPGRAVTFNAGAGIGGGAANPLRIAAGSVVATVTGQTGGIALTGVGDLVIGAGGLSAAGPIALDASGAIRVPTGGTIANGPVSTTKPIRWSVTDTTDNAVDPALGSLRHVLTRANAIGNANASGPDVVITFGSLPNPTRFVLQAQLPTIAAGIEIEGGNTVVIDGNRVVQHGITFGPQAAGSLLKGVTLENFTNYGIQLLAAPSVTVQGVTVRSLNTETSMGLYATGDLSGTKVIRSTFSGGLRGALLDNARSLVFGEVGRGNTLSNNRAAPSRLDFAGTGIRAQGLLTGTIVAGNNFTGNNYGFAFIGAQNLRLERNTFTRNNVAGIYIEGDSRGSVQTGNSFGGPKQDRNKAHVLRARGSQFGGRPVVPATQNQPVVVQRNR